MRLRPIKRKEENLRNMKRKKDCGKRVQKPTLKKKWSVVSINGQDVLEVRRTFPCEREDTLATSFFFLSHLHECWRENNNIPYCCCGKFALRDFFSKHLSLSLPPHQTFFDKKQFVYILVVKMLCFPSFLVVVCF